MDFFCCLFVRAAAAFLVSLIACHEWPWSGSAILAEGLAPSGKGAGIGGS